MASPNQQRQLDILESLIAQKLAVSQQIIDWRENQGFEAASQLVLTGKGKRVMDQMRSHTREMTNEEQKLLAQ